jgi:fructan beta-fructosidase
MKHTLALITTLLASSWIHAAPEGAVDRSVQGAATPAVSVPLERILTVDGSHLIVPVSNTMKDPGSMVLLGIYDGDKLVQDFTVGLPQGNEAFWLAAYPIEPFALKGKQIKVAPADGRKVPESCRAALGRIRIGAAGDALAADDYAKPYRNQFHASTRRGWNNDPNGMVFHGGKYHLYYQYNPFGISWGNMHWGHLESTDLVHWEEKPIALYQRTTKDMAFSGGGFVDHNNSAGLGKGTLFIAFTSTGRGECIAYSKDGGLTFTELPENPVVKHSGRDPKIIWYQPEQKWVMAVFNDKPCRETEATPPQPGSPQKHAHANMAFYESKNLRQWTRTGAFTDPDRIALYECPEMFELPVAGKPGESRWILLGAQNRYFIGKFDGRTFHKESGPLGTTHGAFYAAQTFSDVPDGRRIQIGWVRTDMYVRQFPDQIVNQAFTLPHELTLRETKDGLRVFFSPVAELDALRGELLAEGKNLTPAQADELLQNAAGEPSEVWIEFAGSAPRQILINGMDAGFKGSSARIFTDRTFNEIYADGGISYELRNAPPGQFPSKETKLIASDGTVVSSLKIFRLKSIWNQKQHLRGR